jgi:hypothetical protein
MFSSCLLLLSLSAAVLGHDDTGGGAFFFPQQQQVSSFLNSGGVNRFNDGGFGISDILVTGFGIITAIFMLTFTFMYVLPFIFKPIYDKVSSVMILPQVPEGHPLVHIRPRHLQQVQGRKVH